VLASALVALLLSLLLAGAALVLGRFQDAAMSGIEGQMALTYGVSARARAEIPANYLALYIAAAQRYGLDWSILAGIGRVECDHGRDPASACTVEGAVNSAGAGGPMQFITSTWARYGVDADGEGIANRWDPADAIYGAANYLRSLGAPADYAKAIYGYNHARWYVAEVEHWAALYRGSAGDAGPALGDGGLYIGGERAELSQSDGHLALVPQDVPPAVQAMVIAGNQLQDLPYGPTGHPDPLNATSEDCSSTVNYVFYRAGVRSLAEIVRVNPLAQDYVGWGLAGRGRWVTIYAADSPTPHVFIVIAGLRLDTSHDGTDVGPSRAEDGPRWRILGHLPNWASWSVRHPPGL
jgi:hypothetical protein